MPLGAGDLEMLLIVGDLKLPVTATNGPNGVLKTPPGVGALSLPRIKGNAPNAARKTNRKDGVRNTLKIARKDGDARSLLRIARYTVNVRRIRKIAKSGGNPRNVLSVAKAHPEGGAADSRVQKTALRAAGADLNGMKMRPDAKTRSGIASIRQRNAKRARDAMNMIFRMPKAKHPCCRA